MHETGIEPVVWKTLPLSQAAEAHRELANREAVGRVLLVP
jgi:NADPH:quinone reductase-like Zn-dependent oxidoreductase